MSDDNDIPFWHRDSALTPAYLWAVAVRRRRLIAATFAAVAALAAVVVWSLPPKYQGTMKFLVRKARAEMVVTPDRSSALSMGDVSEAEMNSELELLNARDVLEEVARRTLLASGSEAPTERQQAQAIRQLERSLEVQAVRKANIISVAYTADRPDVALEVLQQYSAIYLEKHLTAHRTPGAYGFFKTQTDHYKDELRRAQSELSDFRLKGGALLLEGQKDLLVRRRSELQAQAAEVKAAIEEVRARIDRLEQATSSMESTVLAQTRTMPNQYSAERLTTMLAEMKNRRTELLMKFQPEDRVVVEVEQQIADTAATLASVQAAPTLEQTTAPSPVRESLISDLSKARIQLVGLSARRQALAREEADLSRKAAGLEAATPEHDALSRELKAAEANYQLYEAKSEEARIAEALDQEKITNVSVAQAPVVPRLPSGPNRAKLLAAGLAFALLVSAAGAAGAEYFNPPDAGSGADPHEAEDEPLVIEETVPRYAVASGAVPGERLPRFKVGRVHDALRASDERREAEARPEEREAVAGPRVASGFAAREF